MLKKIKSGKSLTPYFLLLMSVLVFCVFQYGITKIYGIYLFPDEFGYWSSAATLLGYDWSEIVALGNYYSFGYSVILLPILKFVENATSAYRVAIFINAVCLCGSLFLIFHMLKKMFSDLDEKLLVFVSAIAIFYPSCIYYMQMTLTETFLTFLLLAISAVMLHYIENPRSITAVILAILLCSIYFVHMRTVGIVLSGVLSILLLVLVDKKYRKPCVMFFITLGVLVICGGVLKGFVTENLYHKMSAESYAGNNYVGQIGKIIGLFTVDGIVVFLESCIGKLFYLGSATFGMFYWGMFHLLRNMVELIRKIRNKQEKSMPSMWFFYLFIAVLSHFMVGAIFSMERGPNGRIDALLYGRYNEILVPLMISIGIIAIYQNKKSVQRTILFLFIQGIFAIVVYRYIRTRELTELYTCHVAGLRYAVREMDFYVPEFIGIILIVSSIIALIIVGILLFIRKRKELFWLLGMVIAVEIFLGIFASQKDIYLHNEDNFRDHELAEEIQALLGNENEIKYLYTGGTPYVDLLQFYLRDTKFIVFRKEEQLEPNEEDLILIDAKNSYGEELESKYDSRLESGHFELYYNEN